MSTDDDVMVVIVNDQQNETPAIQTRSITRKKALEEKQKTNKGKIKAKSKKKAKPMNVNDLLHTAEKLGQKIQIEVQIKQEVVDDDEIMEVFGEVEDKGDMVSKVEDNKGPEENCATKGNNATEEKHAAEESTAAEESQMNTEEEYLDCEYLEDFDAPCFKLEPTDEEYHEQDENYNTSVEIEYEKGVHRYKMLSAEERHSHVEDLKKANPELRKNKQLLIQEVAQRLQEQTKPPPVPDNVYYVNAKTTNFECSICGAEKITRMSAVRHYQEKHGPRFLICFACGVDFRSLTNLYKHEKNCRAPDAYIVLKARAQVVARRDPTRPFALPKRSAESKIFHCELCSSQFRTRAGLEAHARLHRGLRPFVCRYCGAAYTSYSALKRHELKHSEPRFECHDCGLKTYNKSTLATHVACHMPEKRFKCWIAGCARGFATKMAAQLHVDSRHLRRPPPLRCEACPKRFRKMSLLKAHMLKQHGKEIITRKMFYKKLPHLPSTRLTEEATVIFMNDDRDYILQQSQTEDSDIREVTQSQERQLRVSIDSNASQDTEYVDVANCTEVLDSNSLNELLDDAENYNVYLIEKGQVMRKMSLDNVKMALKNQGVESNDIIEAK